MQMLRNSATDCHYVAVDTEFPGVVAQLTSDCFSPIGRAYGNIKVNVDLLRPLEIAFSFFRETGDRLCTGFSRVCTIQFNLKWDMHTEPYDENSIHFLQECGLDCGFLSGNLWKWPSAKSQYHMERLPMRLWFCLPYENHCTVATNAPLCMAIWSPPASLLSSNRRWTGPPCWMCNLITRLETADLNLFQFLQGGGPSLSHWIFMCLEKLIYRASYLYAWFWVKLTFLE